MRKLNINKFLLAIAVSFSIITAVYSEEFVTDFLADEYTAGKVFEKPQVLRGYDFTDTDFVAIELNSLKTLSTRDKTLHDTQEVELMVAADVYYKDQVIVKKGEIVSAKIETIIPSGMNGIPYYIYLGDFKFENLKSSKLLCHYSKGGVNRMYWVLPLKWSLTFLPPTGSLTNFIKGGHAKITAKDSITVYYFPNWK